MVLSIHSDKPPTSTVNQRDHDTAQVEPGCIAKAIMIPTKTQMNFTKWIGLLLRCTCTILCFDILEDILAYIHAHISKNYIVAPCLISGSSKEKAVDRPHSCSAPHHAQQETLDGSLLASPNVRTQNFRYLFYALAA